MGWPGPMTHRQYLAWDAWLDWQWDRPGLTEHYLMQAAWVAAQANAKNPRRLKMEQFRLRFGAEKARRPAAGREQAAAWSKAKWLGMMTMPVREVSGGGP